MPLAYQRPGPGFERHDTISRPSMLPGAGGKASSPPASCFWKGVRRGPMNAHLNFRRRPAWIPKPSPSLTRSVLAYPRPQIIRRSRRQSRDFAAASDLADRHAAAAQPSLSLNILCPWPSLGVKGSKGRLEDEKKTTLPLGKFLDAKKPFLDLRLCFFRRLHLPLSYGT
jgi:hypothetical protein